MPLIRSALITGASSGIGAALAERLAAPGVRLFLSGRDAGRLGRTEAACRGLGATVTARVLDVRDAAAMAAWIREAAPLDLVIANAGIGGGSAFGALEPDSQIRNIFAVNVEGALNTVLPALSVMLAQPPDDDGWRGRIAVLASIAAFVPSSSAATYCASKMAIDGWTVANAANARANGIRLVSVCPGYVRTAMTANSRFAMPGLMDADRAARIILRGIATGRTRIAFPWWIALLGRLAGLLPPRVLATLTANAARTKTP